MKRNCLFVGLLLLAAALAANAGTISGKVSGVSGASVVYVNAIAGKTFPPPQKHFLIDQKGLVFQPHILVVPVGATVDFLNSDNVAHNVFWPSLSGNKKLGHNLGTWPKGEKKSFTFDQPGVAPLLCNVHPEMSSYVVVSPTPYYAETDASGDYTIQNIPDGNYTLTAWHEGAKPQNTQVSVGGAAKADFKLSK